jgi:hypothetical protein
LSGDTPANRTLRARIAAHLSWAKTEDRAARTAAARKAFKDRFVREACRDASESTSDCQRRAEHLRKAYFTRLALKSAQARARKGRS